jgi:hypothetical protein
MIKVFIPVRATFGDGGVCVVEQRPFSPAGSIDQGSVPGTSERIVGLRCRFSSWEYEGITLVDLRTIAAERKVNVVAAVEQAPIDYAAIVAFTIFGSWLCVVGHSQGETREPHFTWLTEMSGVDVRKNRPTVCDGVLSFLANPIKNETSEEMSMELWQVAVRLPEFVSETRRLANWRTGRVYK